MEYKDNNKYFGDDFVVDDVAEEEEYKVSIPSCLKNDDPEDSDEDNNGNETKGSKRQRLQCIERRRSGYNSRGLGRNKHKSNPIY